MGNKQEVEIKLALTDSQYLAIRRWLQERALSPEVRTQTDTYFSPKLKSYMKEKYPFEWLSVRSRGDNAILNYKHFYPEGAKRHSHCDEYEVVIESAETTCQILTCLGFEVIAVVRKARSTFLVNDALEVCLDVVDDLGMYLEVEAIQPSWNVETSRKEIESFVRSLGLDPQHADLRGYPYLVWERGGRCGST